MWIAFLSWLDLFYCLTFLTSFLEPTPPNITLNTKAMTKVMEKTAKKLVCNASGSPIPSVTWWKGKKILQHCDEPPCTIVVNSNLTAPPHQHLFTCSADNEVGSHAKTIEMTVLGNVNSYTIFKFTLL